MTAPALRTAPARRSSVAVWAIITLALLSGGYAYYRKQAADTRWDRYQTIAAIGELKSSQIQRWRKERLADARRVGRAPAMRQAIAEFLRDSGRLDRQTAVRGRLQSQLMEDVYDNVLLLGPDGHILLAAKDAADTVDAATRRAIKAALASPEAVLSDFFRAPGGAVDIDVAMALRDVKRQPLAVVILRSRAASYLFPLIQSWPTQSRSAETLLIQREGQDVVLLNALRHRPDTLFSRLPLSLKNIPAVQAVLGRRGKFEGRDLHGVDVLADLRPILGSPWFLVAKVDTDEILAETRDRAGLIGVIVASLILLVAAATAYGYRQRQVGMFRDLYESERQRREVHDAFHTTLSRIGEGVISTDVEGLVRGMNSVAERLTGWSEQDARGKQVGEIFRVIDETTRVRAESPVHAVLRSGTVAEMAKNSLLIARDGTEHPIVESAAPIRDDHGAVSGTVLAFSDQTVQLAAREALRESEERLRLALAAADQGTYDINPQTGAWRVGPDVATMLGYDPAEFHLSRKKWFEMLHPGDRDQVMSRFEDHVAGTLPVFQAEFRLRTKTGDCKWIRTVGKIVDRTHNGEPLRMLGTHTDITERKQAEQALRENAERLEQVIRVTQIGIFDHDHVADVIYWSPQQRHIYGWGLDEPSSLQAFLALVHPEDREIIWPAVQRAHDPSGDGLFDVEHRIIRRDGAIRWLTTRSQTFFDGEGAARHPERTVGAVEDITDRKLAEAEMRLQGAALNAAATPVIITRRDGTITWVNTAFTDSTGYSAAEAIGTNPRSLLKSGTHDPAFYKQMWDTILAGNVWHGEMTNRRKDGSRYSEDMSITPVRDARGEVAHFVAIKRDLTAEKQLQAQFLQAQKMESVGQLAGGIAHDFNNLLTVINSTAELAAMELSEDDPLRGELVTIGIAGTKAAALTRQLLAFSRQQILQPAMVNLNSVVVNLEGMLRRVISENIELAIHLDEDLATVSVDPGQIEQVIMNLVINSRDAMPNGGQLTIETQNIVLDETFVRTHAAVQPGLHVMLAISDTGAGMDEGTLLKMFEPFFTTKGPAKGTGLGLSTAYGIVKQSGGDIQVYSELGHGTTIKVYLPRVDGRARASRTARPETAERGTETVLVVDDAAEVSAMVKRVLERVGYTVLAAGNGVEALQLLENRDGPVHLLLTDMVMPGMSGRALAERIASSHPETKILYTSGYTSDVVVQQGVLEQGLHFIGKPYAISTLTSKVREVLDS